MPQRIDPFRIVVIERRPGGPFVEVELRPREDDTAESIEERLRTEWRSVEFRRDDESEIGGRFVVEGRR